MRITTRLGLLFLLLTVLPLILLGFVTYGLTYDTVRQQVLRVLDNSATNLKWRIELVSGQYLDGFAALTRRHQLQESLALHNQTKDARHIAVIADLLQETLHNSRLFLRFEAFDDDGTLVFTTSSRPEHRPHLDLDRFSKSQEIMPVIFLHRVSQLAADMELASPIIAKGRRVGFLRAQVDLLPLKRLCERALGVGKTEDAVLITNTQSGIPAFVVPPKLLRSDPPLEETLTDAQPRLPMARVEDVFDTLTDYRGASVIAVNRPIEALPWNLIVKVDRQEAFQPLVTIRNFIFLSAALLSLFIVSLSRRVSASFTRPILELSKTARSLREGKLDSRVSVAPSSSELSETCAAFNQMAEQLQFSHRLLTSNIRILEEQDKRTRAIVNSCLDAVISINDLHGVVEWNPAAELIFQYSRGEALGRSVFDLIVPTHSSQNLSERLRAEMHADYEPNSDARSEMTLVRRDGGELAVEIMICSTPVAEQPLITLFIRDLTQQKATEGQNLLLSSILRNSEDAIIGEDLDRIIRVWNDGATRLFGWESSEVIGKPITIILPDHRTAEDYQIGQSLRSGRPIQNLDTTRLRKDGSLVHLSLSVSHIRDAEGRIVGVAKIARDMTEKKRAETFMKASLREKELLIKEIHHRVKNNMQVISSLLRLQSEYLGDEQARQLFKQSDERIRSMAIVHERLYRAETLTEIDLGEYIHELSSYLFRSYSMNPQLIQVKTDLAPIRLGIDQAIPCGLFLNECITNAFKHAFREGEAGMLSISLREDDEDIVLSITDTGRGMPSTFDVYRPTTLGLEIIRTLTDQLQGSLNVRSQPGADFTLRFRPLAGSRTKSKPAEHSLSSNTRSDDGPELTSDLSAKEHFVRNMM